MDLSIFPAPADRLAGKGGKLVPGTNPTAAPRTTHQPRARRGPAFTLVELLVVITIVVVLLALLTPALDRAIYQAELAVCAGQQKAAAAGVLQYAFESRRAYPYRRGPREDPLQWVPNGLSSNTSDDRPVIYRAILPKLLLDPFQKDLEIVNNPPATAVYVNYSLWFGWRYEARNREQGMYRIGDRFTWTDTDTDPSRPVQRSFNLLICDEDRRLSGQIQSTHPDLDGVMDFRWYENAPNINPLWAAAGAFVSLSYWVKVQDDPHRPPVDFNYTYDDASVVRRNRVETLDPDMVFVPNADVHNSTTDNTGAIIVGRQIPR
jgi:prepilin-type N-terminal cleavage/methylation domain-containing protein